MIEILNFNGRVLLIDPTEICAMWEISDGWRALGGSLPRECFSTMIQLRSGAIVSTPVEMAETRRLLDV